ncbi:hypothetical protein [Haloarchaeobius amylolyticus]|uniref:hypothetical protein n=1 Tax=Haloarchaeobius amylolyticus TaxID=1198296 RepID=UPI0022715D95|nr:hypothetical protein [Haloarchaeobius amylolyticus]
MLPLLLDAIQSVPQRAWLSLAASLFLFGIGGLYLYYEVRALAGLGDPVGPSDDDELTGVTVLRRIRAWIVIITFPIFGLLFLVLFISALRAA